MDSMFALMRDVIARVPRGKVITYGEVAGQAGFPGAARQAVWSLRGARGLPWHRVVAAGGRIALPGIQGQEQRLRLESEGVTFRGARVRMDLHSLHHASSITTSPVLSSIHENNPPNRGRRSGGRKTTRAAARKNRRPDGLGAHAPGTGAQARPASAKRRSSVSRKTRSKKTKPDANK
jgi:methylated-DNA-protein-cysteine methyltransferase-like protein